MSRVCPVTGKKAQYGNKVSHSMRHSRRRWDVNLQNTTIFVNGKKERIRVSAAGLRTLRKNAKVEKAAPKAEAAAPAVKEASKVEAAPAETK